MAPLVGGECSQHCANHALPSPPLEKTNVSTISLLLGGLRNCVQSVVQMYCIGFFTVYHIHE